MCIIMSFLDLCCELWKKRGGHESLLTHEFRCNAVIIIFFLVKDMKSRKKWDTRTIYASLCQTQNHTHGCIMCFICLPQQVLLLLTDSHRLHVFVLGIKQDYAVSSTLTVCLQHKFLEAWNPSQVSAWSAKVRDGTDFYCCIKEAREEE